MDGWAWLWAHPGYYSKSQGSPPRSGDRGERDGRPGVLPGCTSAPCWGLLAYVPNVGPFPATGWAQSSLNDPERAPPPVGGPWGQRAQRPAAGGGQLLGPVPVDFVGGQVGDPQGSALARPG